MTELRHQVSDEWVARYDRAIRVGYYASQSCVVVALGACLAGYLVHVPTAWIAQPLGTGLLLFILWVQASKYQTARIRRATAELQEDTHRIDHETAEINAEAQRVRRETAQIQAASARRRGEVQ